MANFFFLRGIPGAGKSTWARKMCKKFPGIFVFCRDSLRFMFFGYPESKIDYNIELEPLLTQIETLSLKFLREKRGIVIIDETNTKGVSQFFDEKKDYIVEFDNIEKAVERNQKRDRVVPSPVMERKIREFQNSKKTLKNVITPKEAEDIISSVFSQ